MKITNDILYVGANDHQIDLFEGQYVVPNGMAYNSYVIQDDKIAVTDAVDERFAKECNYPLHIGITEAGTVMDGSIKSALGLGLLLHQNLGDTLRVSLTGDVVDEVKVAQKILHFMGLRKFGIEFVSCPTCGRTNINLIELANQAQKALEGIQKPIKVAIMGCIVNGPGEAREADLGIAGGKGEGLLFRKGEILRKVPEDQLLQALVEEVKKYE